MMFCAGNVGIGTTLNAKARVTVKPWLNAFHPEMLIRCPFLTNKSYIKLYI
jgi:hypothetical protein